MSVRNKRIVFCIIMVLVVGLFVGITKHRAAEKREAERIQAEEARIQEEAARIQAEARERQAEYNRQQAAAHEAERKVQDEQYAAREAELAANRMPVDEFNAQFLALLNTERMTEPTQRTTNGVNETVTYPFDHKGELSMVEVSSFGGLKSVMFKVNKIDLDNMNAALVFYCAAIQILTSFDDIEYVCNGLRLPPGEALLDNLKESLSVERNGYIFKKSCGSNAVSLIISVK